MYPGPERRKNILSDEEIDLIAEKAADRALAKVYEEVGRSVLKKAAWLTGVVLIGALMWLGGKGFLKF